MKFNKIIIWQKIVFFVSMIVLGICFFVFLSPKNMPPEMLPFLVIILGISIVNFVFLNDFNSNEISVIQAERKQIQKKIDQKEDIIDLIQLNLNQLNEYYSINKNQAKSSYYFSVMVITFGFIVLLLSVWFAMSEKDSKLVIPVISGISGVLLQFIGGLNFVLYNKSLEQVNRFYDQLVKMQDTMLAVDIIRQVDDNKKKLYLTEQLVVSLLVRNNLKNKDISEIAYKNSLEIGKE